MLGKVAKFRNNLPVDMRVRRLSERVVQCTAFIVHELSGANLVWTNVAHWKCLNVHEPIVGKKKQKVSQNAGGVEAVLTSMEKTIRKRNGFNVACHYGKNDV